MSYNVLIETYNDSNISSMIAAFDTEAEAEYAMEVLVLRGYERAVAGSSSRLRATRLYKKSSPITFPELFQ